MASYVSTTRASSRWTAPVYDGEDHGPVFPSTIEDWEEALTTWENDVGRWGASAEETLSSSIKRAILNKNAPKDIRMHLKLQEGVLTNYELTRNAVLSYVLSSQTWHSSVSRAPNTDETADMEIGAVWSKGKGKSKGKKGKDKQGDKETRACFACGKLGRLSSACWLRDNSTEKAQEKGSIRKARASPNATRARQSTPWATRMQQQ